MLPITSIFLRFFFFFKNMWVYDEEKECMVLRELDFVPGLYKIFDEILGNYFHCHVL